MRVYRALRRRGLAQEMADMLNKDAHGRLRESFMCTLARVHPAGYRQASAAQIRKADEVAFTEFSGLMGGVRDACIEEVLAHREFMP